MHLPPPRFISCGDSDYYLFGKTIYPRHGSLETRTQTQYQLIVLISGKLRLTADGVLHELDPGDAILERPGMREDFRFSDETESEHTWCQVSPAVLSQKEKRLLKEAGGVHKASSSIHLLIEEGLSARSADETCLHESLLALAKSCLFRFAADTKLDRRHTAAPVHPALDRALEIAAANYAELHSAEDLARRVGISVTQLRSLCRHAKRESPTDTIWRLKAEHAIQMIRSTGLTLGEIAESCGYSNPFHLSRSVKQYTGNSPRQLRRDEWNPAPKTS